MSKNVHNINVASQDILATPAMLKDAIPLTDALADSVSASRQTVFDILDGRDRKSVV